MRQRNAYPHLFLSLLLTLTSCAGPLSRREPASRIAQAQDLAQSGGFAQTVLPSQPHPLWSYMRLKPGAHSDTIYVYIEGDGVLQINQYGQSCLSEDPTPSPQLPLMLATWHGQFAPEDSIIYLARPCQFTYQARRDRCVQMDWLKGRYGSKALESFHSALDAVREKVHKPLKFHLIGYSGGGTLAMLLANTRKDIAHVTTLAANLDHETFFRMHQETYPPPAFDLVSNPSQIASIPQYHVVGAADPIVPESLLKAYLRKLPAERKAVEMEVIQGQNHRDVEGWQRIWQRLLPQLRTR